MEYEMEMERVVKEIKRHKARIVCIQLPDGLKPKSGHIKSEIEAKTKAKVLIWAGSCFGACDVPQNLDRLGVDLLIQWGHSEF